MPPSTVSVVPVTNELSSLARNSMARATSLELVVHRAGVDGVDPDTARRHLLGQRPRQPDHAGGDDHARSRLQVRLWGFAAERFGWSLLPVGYRVRPPRG